MDGIVRRQNKCQMGTGVILLSKRNNGHLAVHWISIGLARDKRVGLIVLIKAVHCDFVVERCGGNFQQRQCGDIGDDDQSFDSLWGSASHRDFSPVAGWAEEESPPFGAPPITPLVSSQNIHFSSSNRFSISRTPNDPTKNRQTTHRTNILPEKKKLIKKKCEENERTRNRMEWNTARNWAKPNIRNEKVPFFPAKTIQTDERSSMKSQTTTKK